MIRRRFLSTLSLACVSHAAMASATPLSEKTSLGVSTSSCSIRQRASSKPGTHPKFADAVDFLNYCHDSFNAAGVQIGVRDWDENGLSRRLRDRSEELGMYLEGQIALPKEESDVERFEREVRAAKEAGVSIFRTVMLGSRRYETFQTKAAWDAHRERAWKSLTLAEGVMTRQSVQLAVENHKDWRIEEMLSILERLSSESVGINLDTGNNIALLEEPHAVVEALAPFAITTHLKDMAIAEYEDGFLLAEVPLGEGYLDLQRIIQVCRKANPQIRFNLEMITRDPLQIPCLTDSYWTTFENVPAQDLAQMLRASRREEGATLSHPGTLDLEKQIEEEHQNNKRSFAWAIQAGL